MNTREELDNFLIRADELIQSSYILADIKIVNLLKTIAGSKTILAIFENSLQGFDYNAAQKKYLVKSAYLSGEKGEFVMPGTTRELLAFVFYILVEIDAKKLDLSEFINRYFYEDGSFSAGYSAFIKNMIVPLKDAVKGLTESVLSGKLQNPLEALKEEEKRKEFEKAQLLKKSKEDAELAKKSYAENVKKIKTLLLTDKLKIKASKKKDQVKEEVVLVIDTFANAIASGDKDAIVYAFTAYKYVAKAYPFKFAFRNRKMSKLVDGVINEL